ncbi:hypothetical protein, partial [Citreimonas sp.]|uniref:hypothetical protein n=1 Tax=Citreimonas sp. TaxID=3036715 RepID=UPI004058FB3F
PRERVSDLTRGQGGAGPVVTVNVVNQAKGTEAKQRRRRDSDGRETVDVIISESIALGRQDGALGQRVGARPKSVVR